MLFIYVEKGMFLKKKGIFLANLCFEIKNDTWLVLTNGLSN